jgi:hypothetical protein
VDACGSLWGLFKSNKQRLGIIGATDWCQYAHGKYPVIQTPSLTPHNKTFADDNLSESKAELTDRILTYTLTKNPIGRQN